MEIIYSIFKCPEDMEVELRFRIKLNEKDYILINQYPVSKFTSKKFPVPSKSLISSDKFSVEDDNNPDIKNLLINWGKDTFDKDDDDKNIFWISKEEYTIKMGSDDGRYYPMDRLIGEIREEVERIMRFLYYYQKDKRAKSCFEEVLPIDYIDTE